ncbi:MAG: nucleotidyltransferase family protein [Bacteroidales bacterium]|nr:nucleotidyltransferase family protein [Bacteroidales bacterium]
MKTIVLAAGYATRLYPLTENFPKPLLQIGSNTILGRLLDDIDGIPGVSEHIVVTNHKFASIFEKWAAGRGNVTVLDDGTSTNETRLGAVRDLLLAIETFGIDDDILVLAADNILDFSLKGFVEAFRRTGTSMIMCHHEPELYKLQRTGVIEVDDEMKVLQMQEKPQVPVSHWAVPPFYIYARADIPLIKGALEHGCGFDAPGNLAHYLTDASVLHAWPMPAGRFDIGSLDTYEEAKIRYGK